MRVLTVTLSCYRALFPTATPTLYSSLSSFCNTYTTTINIQSTGLPARVTQGCSLDRYKISSACSCNPGKPTPTTVKTTASCAPTPSINLVKNGGFECGLAPWVFTPNDPGYTYRFFSVGDHSQYNIILEGRGSDNKTYATLSQNVAGTVVGQTYALTYRITYDYCYVGRDTIILRALLNGKVVDTVDVCSLPKPGQLYYVNRGVGKSLICICQLVCPLLLQRATLGCCLTIACSPPNADSASSLRLHCNFQSDDFDLRVPQL